MRYAQVFVYSGLLLVALVAAYLTWTHEPPGGKGDVLVIDADADQLQTVVYAEDEQRVTVARRDGGEDGIYWGETWRLKDAPRKPDRKSPLVKAMEGDDDSAGGDDDSAEPAEAEPEEPVKIEETKSFRGNATCDKILARFSPMKAVREFEALSDEKIAEMELAETTATLSVTTTRGERSFDVGGRSYGTNDYYLRDRASGSVYLVESRLVADIKGGSTRLMERQLHAFKKEDVERAAILAGTDQGAFVQMNRDDTKSSFWASADDTSRSHDAADTWLDRVLRLRALEYFAEPPAGLAPAVRVEFADPDGALGWMELGTARGDEGKPIYVASSSHTVAWVEVSDTMGADVLEGLGEVFPRD